MDVDATWQAVRRRAVGWRLGGRHRADGPGSARRGRRVGLLALLLLAMTQPGPVGAAEPVAVDVALVLAVDVSWSMDADEQQLQRDGYARSLTSPEVLNVIAAGKQRRIAITYVEWAGAADQLIVVPWRIIDGAESAKAFTAELLSRPFRRASRTSIAGALLYSAPLFDTSGVVAARRVIDVSGDGPNNQGMAVTEARSAVLARGIIINGLPIIWRRARPGLMDIDNLDEYYEACVIGGDASFMVPIRTRDNIFAATRMKLLLEIAEAPPRPRIIPAAASPVDCQIGEKLWQQRFGTIRN